MMFSTHILVGAVLGYGVSAIASAEVATLIIAGMIGGLIPELDFIVGKHRKTLHYPFSYFITALIPLTGFLMFQIEIFLLLATVLLAAGVHSFMDIFAGAELRSWNRNEWKETAVYNHIGQKWISPRRWAYGGSKQDLLLSIICFGTLVYWISNIRLNIIFTVLLTLSFLYSLTIKWFSEEFVGEYSTLNQYVRSKLRF